MSVRHDWYQTDTKVVITVLLKNAAEKNCQVKIEPESVLVTAENYSLDLLLFDRANVEASSYRIGQVKVEITLAKQNGIRWTTLTKESNDEKPGAAGGITGEKIVNIFRKDWDVVSKEIEKDVKKEEDNDLNKLFQSIYTNSSDEVRKAMNKSFTESGGTVLSTNWDEISSKRVDVRPPDGAEFRKWEE